MAQCHSILGNVVNPHIQNILGYLVSPRKSRTPLPSGYLAPRSKYPIVANTIYLAPPHKISYIEYFAPCTVKSDAWFSRKILRT